MGIVVSNAEPAIVQDEKLNAELLGFLSEFMDLSFIELEVSGFPVVICDGARLVLPSDRHDVLVDEGMHVVSHAIKSFARVRHDRHRGNEFVVEKQADIKEQTRDTHLDSDLAKRGFLDLLEMVSGID